MIDSWLVYVGTYSVRGSEGIYAFRLDAATGALAKIATAAADNASFLALSPDRRRLYAVHESTQIDGESVGAASAYSIDATTGRLTKIGETQAVDAVAPCHAHIDKTGRWLITANYGSGTHSILPIQPQGGGLEPIAARRENVGEPGPGQESAHAHSTWMEPDGRLAYACDLGLDRVIAYALDPSTGRLDELEGGGAILQPRAGPRHLAMHPALPLLYVINELNSTIAVLRKQDDSPYVMRGRLAVEQIVSTLPSKYNGENACADIHFSPDAKFLYGSNRGHDSLAAFTVNAESGLLTPLAHVATGGAWPRNFATLPNGLLLVANERSDNIVSFLIGADGIPVSTGLSSDVPSPVCVLPLA